VYDLGTGRQNEWQKEEKKEETSRLYYVALTRAQCLLYAPYLADREGRRPQSKGGSGQQSPLPGRGRCLGREVRRHNGGGELTRPSPYPLPQGEGEKNPTRRQVARAPRLWTWARCPCHTGLTRWVRIGCT